MTKRLFRKSKQPTQTDSPTYPTLDRGRRQVLARLGAVVVGVGAGASLLSACGDGRAIHAEPDLGGPAGVAPLPDAEIDPPTNDGGAAPMPDAEIDRPPDGMEIGGVAPPPDAAIDKPEPDMIAAPGYAPVMDAAVDGKCPNP